MEDEIKELAQKLRDRDFSRTPSEDLAEFILLEGYRKQPTSPAPKQEMVNVSKQVSDMQRDVKHIEQMVQAIGLLIDCSKCGQRITQPGALIFSPPDKYGTCLKQHICVECFGSPAADVPSELSLVEIIRKTGIEKIQCHEGEIIYNVDIPMSDAVKIAKSIIDLLTKGDR